jgi:hypothetical protein
VDAHVHDLVFGETGQHALVLGEDWVRAEVPWESLRRPPTAEVSVWMMGKSTKMVMLLPNIQNMKTVMRIWDLLAVATSNSF